MKLINDLLDDLITYANELNCGMIRKEEFNLNMELLIERVKRIEINFKDTNITNHHNTFNQLLFKVKFKTIETLQQLQKETHKRIINGCIRKIIAEKLYFNSIHMTVVHCINAYRHHETIKLLDIQIFIESDVKEDAAILP